MGGDAPDGHEALTVLVNAPPHRPDRPDLGIDWDAEGLANAYADVLELHEDKPVQAAIGKRLARPGRRLALPRPRPVRLLRSVR